ncbi:MAG: hypothetical protein ACXAEN_14335 [Candidatus Thorarchaeota archaeon]|jgi:hypothetical protein
MNLNTAISQATRHLLDSDKARTYVTKPDVWGEQKSYVLELERIEDDRNVLEISTWGFDYARIAIPLDRPEMIKIKMWAQLRLADAPYSPIDQVVLRYCLDILHRESNR